MGRRKKLKDTQENTLEKSGLKLEEKKEKQKKNKQQNKVNSEGEVDILKPKEQEWEVEQNELKHRMFKLEQIENAKEREGRKSNIIISGVEWKGNYKEEVG